MKDDEIIQLYWNRDENAIKETEVRFHKILASIAYRILNNYEDVRECLNDTYLKAWHSMPTLWPKNLCAYLCKIIRNDAIDRYHSNATYKRQGQTYAVALEELNDCLGKNDVQENFDAMVTGEAITRFLKTCRKEQRVLFICRYFFYDDLKEAARHAGVSEVSAKVTLFRMRKKLKEFLEKEGVWEK